MNRILATAILVATSGVNASPLRNSILAISKLQRVRDKIRILNIIALDPMPFDSSASLQTHNESDERQQKKLTDVGDSHHVRRSRACYHHHLGQCRGKRRCSHSTPCHMH